MVNVSHRQPTSPQKIAFTPDGRRAYITDPGNGLGPLVAVVDAVSMNAVTYVPVGRNPGGITMSPDGSRAYVTNSGDNTVSVINTNLSPSCTDIALCPSVIATVPVGMNPRGIAITPDGTRVYVANEFDNSVSVIGTATNSVVATITNLASPAFSSDPTAVVIAPDGTRAYVTNNGGTNTTTVIDTATNTLLPSIPINSAEAGITPDGKRLYATNSQVAVIDTATDAVVTYVSGVGTGPFAVAITPDGTRVYVTALNDGTVSAINTATNTVVATIPVGNTPFGISVMPVTFNTPGGSNIAVHPVDATTGMTPVTLTFSNVTQAGTTSLTTSGTGSPPPSGFKLGTPPTYYQLTTTAVFSGPVTVCVNFSPGTFGKTSKLRLFHFIGGTWVDVTTSLDTTNDIICGNTTSLSPFAVFESAYTALVQAPINPNGSSVFNASRGAVPVKFTLSLNGQQTCQLPPATIALTRTAGAAPGPINQGDYILASDSGSNFRVDTSNCQYVYNLATSSLGVGTYVVSIQIGGVPVGNATFGLQ